MRPADPPTRVRAADPPLRAWRVVVSAMVPLKMAQHARSAPGEAVLGPLLGMVHRQTRVVEVTDCFPVAVHDATSSDGKAYETQMLERFKLVGVDHMQVGHYQVRHPTGAVDCAPCRCT